MARKTVDFNRSGIAKLPDNKPAVYRIKTDGGRTNYAARISESPSGKCPDLFATADSWTYV